MIDRIDNDNELPTLYFKAFHPLPQEKWVQGLTGKEITGAHFKQGHYRYLDDKHETYLASLVEKGKKAKQKDGPAIASATKEKLELQFRKDIRDKIGKIAFIEGRTEEDLIREAVAKLIRERGL